MRPKKSVLVFLFIPTILAGLFVIVKLFHIHVGAFDKYPYILLNLFFSWQASNAASFILIAQNDQAARDKVQAEHQYEHQEQELKVNTELTQAVHDLVQEIHSSLPAQGKKS